MIDDVMLKGIRKLPLDLTSADASTLTDAFASFRKLVGRAAPFSFGLLQSHWLTALTTDGLHVGVGGRAQHASGRGDPSHGHAAKGDEGESGRVHAAVQSGDASGQPGQRYEQGAARRLQEGVGRKYCSLSFSLAEADALLQSSLKQAREGHEQATLRERKSLSADGSVRRKSFMQTVLRKPVRKYREKLDSALEAAEKAHALSEEATRALDAAVEERNRCVNNLLDGLQQAQRKRVETMRFAMLACLEQYQYVIR